MSAERRTCVTCGVEKPRQSFFSTGHATCRVCMKAQRKAQEAPSEVTEHRDHKAAVKEAVKAEEKKTGEELTPRQVTAIDKELAARVLARRRLLAFIERFNPDYQAGWVHRDICRRLERFAEQIDAKQSPRLMLLMPPRHGKSEIASRNFPAWYLGTRPKHEVVAASHTGSLALDFSRRVREIVRDPGYNPVFPDMRLDPNTQALEKWMSLQGGSYTAVGVGGSLTGKGAHCFPQGTAIMTALGEKPIETVVPGEPVLAYNHQTESFCWRRAQAISRRQAPGLYRVTTTAGRVVEATADHPFYAEGRYTHAAKLTPGDRLLCAVRAGSAEGGLRGEQALLEGAHGVLLFQSLLGNQTESHSIRRETMLGVRNNSAEGDILRERRDTVLLEGVHGGSRQTAPGAQGAVEAREEVPNLSGHVYATADGQAGGTDVLLGTVCQHQTLQTDGGGVQPKMEVWGLPASPAAALSKGLSDYAPSGVGARRAPVCSVSGERCSSGGAPHRQLADEQRLIKSRDALLEVSPGMACCRGFEAIQDTVALVERLHEDETCVFDLQIEETHNFFANGILVHNCLIIDDPVKDLTEADSQTIRDSIFGWYGSTARTRLAPGGGVLLIQTWWNDDDLAGRLQMAMKEGGEQFEVVKYPAINEGYDEYLGPDEQILSIYAPEAPPMGSRLLRRADTALHPDRYDLKELKALKASYEAAGQKRIWSALYQQNPIPDEGLYFTKDMFQWYDDAPDLVDARIIQAWDFAITEKQTSDWTVGMCVAQMPDDDLYVLDMRRFRSGDSIAIVDTMIDFWQRHRAFVLGVEDGQIWKAISALFFKSCRERRIYPNLHLNRPLTDKQVRASPLRGRMQQGKVFFPRKGSWATTLEQEMLRFPAGKHDDCVDGLAWAVRTALDFTAPPVTRRDPHFKSWKDRLNSLPGGSGGHMSA